MERVEWINRIEGGFTSVWTRGRKEGFYFPVNFRAATDDYFCRTLIY